MKLKVALAAALFCVAEGISQNKVGILPDGGYLLNNGWTLRPAGDLVPVGSFPMSAVVSNDGKYLLVLNAGAAPPGISTIDIARKKELGRTLLPDVWLGLIAAPTSNLVYVGGGGTGRVYELSLGPDGTLSRTREFVVETSKTAGIPFVGDVALSPDARILYAADLRGDSIAQINLQSGKTVDHWKTGKRPYRILVSPNGAQLLISSWAEAAVYEHESGTGVLITKLRVGSHPTDMLWLKQPFAAESSATTYQGRLFVASSNTNTVFSFGVNQDGQFSRLNPINVAFTPMQPLGMTPSALAADPQGTRLFIACSDANSVAVADLTNPSLPVLAMIPAGWYPTAVQFLRDGSVVSVNGKGSGKSDGERAGSVAFATIAGPDQLAALSRTARENSPYRDDLIYGPITDPAETRFSRTQERPSPIQRVIYVIKGDLTFDQLLGDLGSGNGDRSKVRFGNDVTPNQHALAHEFVLYDNFYSNGDFSAEGSNWAVAAIAPDFIVKLAPHVFSGRSGTFTFDNGDLANAPPSGYLWSNALQAGLTVRNYGEWVTNTASPQAAGQRQVQRTNGPPLAAVTDLNFRGPDSAYKDTDRAGEFIREWKAFDSQGQPPQLSIVRLSNDAATKEGPPSAAMTRDNDHALGMLVDAVSHSRFWASTAIFVVQTSGEQGSDHVDPHRTPCWILSPYTHRAAVDTAFFNQTSALRTIELILGMRPMTLFDAGARTMFGSFAGQASANAFTALMPKS